MDYIGGCDLWTLLQEREEVDGHDTAIDTEGKSLIVELVFVLLANGLIFSGRKILIDEDHSIDLDVPPAKPVRILSQVGCHWSQALFYFAEAIEAVEHMHRSDSDYLL